MLLAIIKSGFSTSLPFQTSPPLCLCAYQTVAYFTDFYFYKTSDININLDNLSITRQLIRQIKLTK